MYFWRIPEGFPERFPINFRKNPNEICGNISTRFPKEFLEEYERVTKGCPEASQKGFRKNHRAVREECLKNFRKNHWKITWIILATFLGESYRDNLTNPRGLSVGIIEKYSNQFQHNSKIIREELRKNYRSIF